MVGRIFFCSLVSVNCREQKKCAPRFFLYPRVSSPPSTPSPSSSSKCFATVYAMVDCPEPAWPVNQKIEGDVGEGSTTHRYIRSRMSTRVPGVHGSRLPDGVWLRSAL